MRVVCGALFVALGIYVKPALLPLMFFALALGWGARGNQGSHAR